MLWRQSLIIALENLWGNKTRSILTMLGMVIGVAAIVLIFAIGKGGQLLIVKELELFGSNLIVVQREERKEFNSLKPERPQGLTSKDAEEIVRGCPEVVNAAPVIYYTLQISKGKKIRLAWIMGTTPGYSEARRTELLYGRFLTEEDLEKRSKVCILDDELSNELFGSIDPIGEKVKIGFFTFKVIGVSKKKVSSISEVIQERQPTVIPMTVLEKISGIKDVPMIFAQAESYSKVEEATREIRELLSKRMPQDEVKITTLKDLLKTINKIINIVSLIVGSIAAISLIVGGIGIMNIMLVSVTERTREIGIRIATGARRKDILLQFLIESSSMSGFGGILGILLGVAGSILVAQFAKWPPVVTSYSIILAFCFSVAVGITFGLYPANKAAKLDPVEALRYE